MFYRFSRTFYQRAAQILSKRLAFVGALAIPSYFIFNSDNFKPRLLTRNIPFSYKCEAKIPFKEHNDYGWTPLHEAVANCDINAVQALINSGADLDARDEFTFRVEGDLDDVFKLIKERQSRFPFNPQGNFKGATALHYAMAVGSLEIIRMLIENGANWEIRDHLNKCPREYSTKKQVREFYDELIKNQILRNKKLEQELRKKFPLEQRLKQAIIGQEGPIDAVSSAIRRRENGWNNEEKPLVLMFMGSSGIGKTEVAKQVAKYLFKDEKGFIRIDMSEFQNQHEVSKFIGSPPGYVGHEEGGQLTRKLSEKPDSVVLFDEIEKAHPDILTVMLQLFDEGRLTDGKGKTIECKDAIFIMTSNLAQQEIANKAEHLRDQAEESKQVINKQESIFTSSFVNESIYPILRRHFKRDEFLGRIDEIVFFLPFNQKELNQLTEQELNCWAKRADSRHGMKISWTPQVVSLLSQGYNKRYGARSIKHLVDKLVINQLAKAHELGQISKGSLVTLDVVDGKIELKITNNQKKFFSLF